MDFFASGEKNKIYRFGLWHEKPKFGIQIYILFQL